MSLNIRPDSLGDWARELKAMTVQRRQRGPTDRQLRVRYDASWAAKLAAGLEVMERARVSSAHAKPRAPLAREARKVALGIEQPSIFELLLRFAKRWPG